MHALAREVDPYGDSYAIDADERMLEASLAEVAAKHPHPFDMQTAGGAAAAPAASPVPRGSHAHHVQSHLPVTLQLHLAKAAPANYRSQFLSLTPSQQKALSSPARAFIGSEVFVYGKQESNAAKLCLITLQLLGARITPVLSKSVTHILMLPSTTAPAAGTAAGAGAAAALAGDGAEFTKEALRECAAGVGLKLQELPSDDAELSLPLSASTQQGGSAAASSASAASCILITPAWVEQQRRAQTEKLNHMAAGAGAS